jgi:glutamyl-tRNA synthetase
MARRSARPQHFEPAQLSDPVVRRADGSWLYMLPSAVDDIEMGVTDVLRGEDHVSNTALQIQMFTALGGRAAALRHEALLVGSEGKLSKRLGSLGCDAFRENGIEPEALVALLARLGTLAAVEPIAERGAAGRDFRPRELRRAPARFDDAELARLMPAIVHQLPFAHGRFAPAGGHDRGGWEAIRPNLERLADAGDWWRVVTGPIDPPAFDDETRAYLAEAARTLAWSEDPWGPLTRRVKDATGRKGKALFLPLRQALTGATTAPTCTRCCR